MIYFFEIDHLTSISGREVMPDLKNRITYQLADCFIKHDIYPELEGFYRKPPKDQHLKRHWLVLFV